MEDRTNGYIYEIASPVELGVAGYRGQALIVWRHGDGAETAQLVRVVPAETLSDLLWNAGLLLSQIQRSTLWLLQGLSPKSSFGGFGLSLLPTLPWAVNRESDSIWPPTISSAPGSSITTMGTFTSPNEVLALLDMALSLVLLALCVAPSRVVASIQRYSPVGSNASRMKE